MDIQFTDLTVPNREIKYWCDTFIKSTGFTHLMKLVRLIDKFPEAIIMIKDILLNTPSEVNKQNNKGWNALLIACRNCNSEISLECINLLIISGADLNMLTSAGNTPLLLACLNVNKFSYDCINLLVKSGAGVNLQNTMMCTALMILCGTLNNYSFKCIKLLVRSGVSINLKDIKGCSCLMYLFHKNFDEIVYNCAAFLIKSGANVNLQMDDGLTALMFVCGKKYYKLIELLINSGADIHLQDINGNTALHHFCGVENLATADLDIITMFMYKNYDPSLLNKDRVSVYQYFTMYKNPDADNEYIESLLQGKNRLSNTKSSRK